MPSTCSNYDRMAVGYGVWIRVCGPDRAAPYLEHILLDAPTAVILATIHAKFAIPGMSIGVDCLQVYIDWEARMCEPFSVVFRDYMEQGYGTEIMTLQVHYRVPRPSACAESLVMVSGTPHRRMQVHIDGYRYSPVKRSTISVGTDITTGHVMKAVLDKMIPARLHSRIDDLRLHDNRRELPLQGPLLKDVTGKDTDILLAFTGRMLGGGKRAHTGHEKIPGGGSLMIYISGDSGSGKTTLVKSIGTPHADPAGEACCKYMSVRLLEGRIVHTLNYDSYPSGLDTITYRKEMGDFMDALRTRTSRVPLILEGGPMLPHIQKCGQVGLGYTVKYVHIQTTDETSATRRALRQRPCDKTDKMANHVKNQIDLWLGGLMHGVHRLEGDNSAETVSKDAKALIVWMLMGCPSVSSPSVLDGAAADLVQTPGGSSGSGLVRAPEGAVTAPPDEPTGQGISIVDESVEVGLPFRARSSVDDAEGDAWENEVEDEEASNVCSNDVGCFNRLNCRYSLNCLMS